jgi:hypothetical protein
MAGLQPNSAGEQMLAAELSRNPPPLNASGLVEETRA